MNTTKFLFAAALATSLFTGCKESIAPTLKLASIEGKIACAKDPNQGLANVEIEVLKNGTALQTISTDATGAYAIDNLDASATYTLNLSKAEKFNGTTLSLVLFSKTVLGLPSTASSYQLLAADANLSGTVDEADVTELRSIILGVNTAETKVWRFVTPDYEFPSAENPKGKGSLNSLIINTLEEGKNTYNFIPVKLGDFDMKETCK
jgi:hypothetical protein